MYIHAIIQARFSSVRFPGKSLHNFNGKPSIMLLVEALRQCRYISDIVIATSDEFSDDIIAETGKKNGCSVFRGNLANVASRFYEICASSTFDYFIRLCGDSPLFDYHGIDNICSDFPGEYEIVSTVPSLTFPSGMNFEIVKRTFFLDEYVNFTSSAHFEHVTKYFYENSEKFRIFPVKSGIENSRQFKFSFDDENDRKRIQDVFDQLDKPHYQYSLEEKCNILKANPSALMCSNF
ncbi:MAG: hypothetical protein HQM10_09130 [Candidatus Riflebacteria bacterium]|nr:hypothetical protein [Candidatus Riflebacteria bacterium]